MEDPQIPATLWFLSGATLFLLLLVWMGQHRLAARLRSIEYRLSKTDGQKMVPEPSLSERKAENKEQKQLFQEFLGEDPARRDLPKKEQFAAFRKWRTDKGLNWSPESSEQAKPA